VANDALAFTRLSFILPDLLLVPFLHRRERRSRAMNRWGYGPFRQLDVNQHVAGAHAVASFALNQFGFIECTADQS
jgi:hypothetical protein